MRFFTICVLLIVTVGVASGVKEEEVPTPYPAPEVALDRGLRTLIFGLCLRCVDFRRTFIVSPDYDFLCLGAPKDGCYKELSFIFFSSCSKTKCREALTRRFTGLIPITKCYSNAPVPGRNTNRFGYRHAWYYNPKLEYNYVDE